MNWTKRHKPDNDWIERDRQKFLLTEALWFLLQENGWKITLDDSYELDTSWDKRDELT